MRDFPLPQKHILWLIVPKQLLRRMRAKKLFTLGCTQLCFYLHLFFVSAYKQLPAEEYPAPAFLDWTEVFACSVPVVVQPQPATKHHAAAHPLPTPHPVGWGRKSGKRSKTHGLR